MDDKQLHAILLTIADEWQCGGLSGEDNLYAALAVETAKRAVAAEREACAAMAENHLIRETADGFDEHGSACLDYKCHLQIAEAIRARTTESKWPTMTDSFEKIARTTLAQLVKAGNELDEAERLLMATYAGTEKWCNEVSAWRKRKDALIDCSRNTDD